MIRALGARGRYALAGIVLLTVVGVVVALATAQWVDVIEVALLGSIGALLLATRASCQQSLRLARQQAKAGRRRFQTLQRLRPAASEAPPALEGLQREHRRTADSVAELSRLVRDLSSRVTYPALGTPRSFEGGDAVLARYADYLDQPMAVQSDRLTGLVDLLSRDATRRASETEALRADLMTIRTHLDELISTAAEARSASPAASPAAR